jgi:hypothetical protein
MVVVSLPDVMKPATLIEKTVIIPSGATRGRMVLRVSRRLCMNVGDPNSRGIAGLWLWESDMPIVVKMAEKVKAAGAKGH